MKLPSTILLLAVACSPRPRLEPIDPFAPPVVGVTASVEGQNAAVGEALTRAGAEPRFLLPEPGQMLEELVAELDAVVLGGGADLDPQRYGEPPHESIRYEDSSRQRLDLTLAETAFAWDVPLLGVCLGAQAMAVHRGGTLIQDIPSELAEALDHYAAHSITIEPGSPLAPLYPRPEILVSSLHHQAVDELPAGLEVAARAQDGVVEAFWDPAMAWAVGLQYHPERDATDEDLHAALWAEFVEQARKRRRNRPAARGSN